jgi:hypothetical protein
MIRNKQLKVFRKVRRLQLLNYLIVWLVPAFDVKYSQISDSLRLKT